MEFVRPPNPRERSGPTSRAWTRWAPRGSRPQSSAVAACRSDPAPPPLPLGAFEVEIRRGRFRVFEVWPAANEQNRFFLNFVGRRFIQTLPTKPWWYFLHHSRLIHHTKYKDFASLRSVIFYRIDIASFCMVQRVFTIRFWYDIYIVNYDVSIVDSYWRWIHCRLWCIHHM